MKIFIVIFLSLIYLNVSSQDFETQIYYGYDTNYHSTVIGNIRNLTDSDSLARIYFTSDAMFLNAYFACTYNFKDDTLFLNEIKEDIFLDYRIKKRAIPNVPKDSIYLTYQVYYESGGNAIYDSLEFIIDGISFPDSLKSDSHSAKVKAPISNSFTLNVFNKTVLLDSFEITLENGENSIYLSKSIFNSSYFINDEIKNKIPKSCMIDEKEFVLIIDYQDFFSWVF